jgi:hypothetical protein
MAAKIARLGEDLVEAWAAIRSQNEFLEVALIS